MIEVMFQQRDETNSKLQTLANFLFVRSTEIINLCHDDDDGILGLAFIRLFIPEIYIVPFKRLLRGGSFSQREMTEDRASIPGAWGVAILGRGSWTGREILLYLI